MLFVSRGNAPVSHRDLANAQRGFLILDSDAFYRAVAECIRTARATASSFGTVNTRERSADTN